MHMKMEIEATYLQAGSSTDVTDGVVMGAAAVKVITAGGAFQWAASPYKACV